MSHRITPSARLRAVSDRADRTTLLTIAAMLLEADPPPWLGLAIVQGEVHYEIIPSADLDGLAWLGTDLDQTLQNAAPPQVQSNDLLALGIGRAAELMIVAAIEARDASPIHVSEISDRFGYDIESAACPSSRWEVKGCVERTAGGFHLSRNEYEVGCRYPNEWVLVQVEFVGEALVAEQITAAHIASIRELVPAQLNAIIPPDSTNFSWETSAWVRPPARAWNSSELSVPPDFRVPSLDSLGHVARALRAQRAL